MFMHLSGTDLIEFVQLESTPSPVLLMIFLLPALLVIHLAYPAKWSFLEHPSFETICIHKTLETLKCLQSKIPVIQLVFEGCSQCDSKVFPQNYFHGFSLMGLCEFPTISHALLQLLGLHPVASLDLLTLQALFTF